MLSTTLIANTSGGALGDTMMLLARGGSEWILWILVVLSGLSFLMFFERLLFFRSVRADMASLSRSVVVGLADGDVRGIVEGLRDAPSMPARVVAYGLKDASRGRRAVEDLCRGAIGTERLRYERGLGVLATIGSNAPFIGLFGTVMGVIVAFEQLGVSGADPSTAVMAAIAEALIATGVGLLVAIPAIVFYNLLRARVKRAAADTELLVQTMLAYLE